MKTMAFPGQHSTMLAYDVVGDGGQCTDGEFPVGHLYDQLLSDGPALRVEQMP
jgi:hypothetical protein